MSVVMSVVMFHVFHVQRGEPTHRVSCRVPGHEFWGVLGHPRGLAPNTGMFGDLSTSWVRSSGSLDIVAQWLRGVNMFQRCSYI